jgi:hypothetical protein
MRLILASAPLLAVGRMLRPSSQSERGLRLRRRSQFRLRCAAVLAATVPAIFPAHHRSARMRGSTTAANRAPARAVLASLFPAQGLASAPAERASMPRLVPTAARLPSSAAANWESKAADARTPCAEARGRNLVRPSLLSRQCRSRSRGTTSLYFRSPRDLRGGAYSSPAARTRWLCPDTRRRC